MKTIAALIGALLAVNAYAAETYNVEAGVRYLKNYTDDKTDISATGFGGSYYFKNIVIDGTQPFMELDTLQKASSVSMFYNTATMETGALAKTAFNPLLLSGTLYADNFILGINNDSWTSAFNLKADATKSYKINSSATGLNVGYWVTPTTAVSLVNNKDNATYDRSSTSLPAVPALNITTNSVTSHTVTSLGGTQSLVVDLGYSQIKQVQTTTETNTEYAAKARYYPEAKYFVEGGFRLNSGDSASERGKTFLMGAGYAFTPRFAILLSTLKFSGDVRSENSSKTATTVTAGYRF